MQFYNSQTGQKEVFQPRNPGQVLLYVCGITPYDTTHLGHAFTYVFFDTLVRYLTSQDYQVAYTQNVTDLDDDILNKAKETKQNWRELGKVWTGRFLKDMDSLNVLRPTSYVKATSAMNQIIKMIKELLDQGVAYEKTGNVYFEVKKFNRYGRLSRFNRSQMIRLAQERGGDPQDPLKTDPLDFRLWQKGKSGEPTWDSPWSRGRPGWHIECSAMIHQYLGSQIDIHGGGRDLIFPHHENETAQSESYTQQHPLAKCWFHTAMVMYQGEKMSKSLGNLVMVADLLDKYSPEAVRWVLLSHHYRQPWEFSEAKIREAGKIWLLIKKSLPKPKKISVPKGNISHHDLWQGFLAAMDDDLNTPAALQALVNQVSRSGPQPTAGSKLLGQTMTKILLTLGFKI